MNATAPSPTFAPGRFCVGLLMLLCGPLCAEPLKVDESKLPDWVKRQAQMPYRVIIQNAAPQAAAAPALAATPRKAAVALPKKPAVAEGLTGSTTTAEFAVVAPPLPAVERADVVPVPAPASDLEERAQETVAMAAPALLPLTLVERVDPNVSNDLLTGGKDKQVLVAFTVQPHGEVTDAQVVSSSDSRLNRPVLRAVRGWRYEPIPQARQHSVSFEFVAEP